MDNENQLFEMSTDINNPYLTSRRAISRGSVILRESPAEGVHTTHYYPTFSTWISHSCLPNTVYKFSEVDNTVVLIAATDIKEGELIEVNRYDSGVLYTTYQRNEYLFPKSIFCMCRRCVDPSELGTGIGALKCLQRSMETGKRCDGLVFRYPSLENSGNWHCNTCGGVMKESHANCSTYCVDDIPFSVETLDDIDRCFTYIAGTVPSLHSKHLRLHFDIVTLIGRELLAVPLENFDPPKLKRLIDSAEIVLTAYSTLRPDFHPDTGYILLAQVFADYLLARENLKKFDETANPACLLAKAMKPWFQKLQFAQDIFMAFQSIPKFKGYMEYVQNIKIAFNEFHDYYCGVKKYWVGREGPEPLCSVEGNY